MGFTFSNHQLPMLEILKDHLKIESVSALTFTLCHGEMYRSNLKLRLHFLHSITEPER